MYNKVVKLSHNSVYCISFCAYEKMFHLFLLQLLYFWPFDCKIKHLK